MDASDGPPLRGPSRGFCFWGWLPVTHVAHATDLHSEVKKRGWDGTRDAEAEPESFWNFPQGPSWVCAVREPQMSAGL